MREIVGKEPLGARETPAVGDQWGGWRLGADESLMHSRIAKGGLHDHARGGHHLKEARNSAPMGNTFCVVVRKLRKD